MLTLPSHVLSQLRLRLRVLISSQDPAQRLVPKQKSQQSWTRRDQPPGVSKTAPFITSQWLWFSEEEKSSLSTSGLRKKPVKHSDFEVVGKHHSPFPAGSLPFTPCDRELHAAVRVRTHSLEQERHVLHVTSTQTAFHTSWPAAVGSQGAQPASALLLSRAFRRWSKVYHEGM